jgi:TolB-like protein
MSAEGADLADIFISYARADQAKVRQIAAALENGGHSVWWDRHINAGAEFADDIERELAAAKAVLVCWSESGVRSRWVKDEACIAAEEDKLVAVSIDGSQPPIGFRQYHALSFERWRGSRDAQPFDELLRAIDAKLDPDRVRAPQSRVAPTQAKPAIRRTALLAAFAVAIVAALASFMLLRPETGDAPIAPDAASIAVLPFADLSPAGDQQYFADGMSEEILNVLSRVDGLRVASRTSSFRHRDREGASAGEIAGALNVRHLLDGSVRRAGDKLRVSARLIDARSDSELWSQTFDRDLTMDNLFAIQDEIAGGIVRALGEQMELGHADALKFAAAADTKDLDAYSDYLRGQSLFNARTATNYPQILAAFRAAVDKDPGFTRAWVGLGGAYSVASTFLSEQQYRQGDYAAKAREAAERAIQLEPDFAMAHAVAANVALMEGYDAGSMTRAMAEFDQALELDPNEPLAHNWRAQLKATVGDFAGARDDITRAIAIDPGDTVAHELMVALHLYADDVDGALRAQRKAGRYLPTLTDALALALARRGDRASMNEVVELMGGDWQSYAAFIERIAAGNVPPRSAQPQMERILASLGDEVPRVMTQFRRYMIRDFDSLADAPEGNFPIYWMRTWPAFLDHPARYENMAARDLGAYWARHGLPPMCKAIDRRSDGRNFECA